MEWNIVFSGTLHGQKTPRTRTPSAVLHPEKIGELETPVTLNWQCSVNQVTASSSTFREAYVRVGTSDGTLQWLWEQEYITELAKPDLAVSSSRSSLLWHATDQYNDSFYPLPNFIMIFCGDTCVIVTRISRCQGSYPIIWRDRMSLKACYKIRWKRLLKTSRPSSSFT